MTKPLDKNLNLNPTTEKISPDISLGLSSVQVEERKAQGLINACPKKYSKSYLSIFTDNVFTFFNLLGLIAFIALIYAKAELFNFVFVIVFIANISIGIIQEIRAKICIDRLSIVSSKTVKVIRDGVQTDIPSDEIVLSDIIKLSAGCQIPADASVLDGDIEVNESLLTGESLPIKKKKGDILLSGSFIISGSCTAIVEQVGSANYAQKLSAKAKKYKKPRSEIMNSLYLLIKIIGFVLIPIAVLNMIKSLVGSTTDKAIISTATMVIGMIPSGMILLTSLALAIGIIKLAAKNTLVQDLYSLETLARVDTICFDKTGTLTDGKMTVSDTLILDDKFSDKDIKDIVSSILGSVKDENHTAISLAEYFGTDVKFTADSFIPFSSKRKYSAVSFKEKGVFALGAPEFILSKAEFSKIKSTVDPLSAKGYRTILLAKANLIESENIDADNALPVALILLEDNIRSEAVNTVKWFNDNDVEIKIISGDDPITVANVAKRVGVINYDKNINLYGLPDEEVEKAANEYTVFGRVSPEQKAILIKSIKKDGHVTAMTGDGVNDILALKEADCAISVASGSEAARNIAHLVLLDNNFNSMPDIVFEGRRVINNVQGSSSLYLMKTLFVMLLSFLTLIVPYMKDFPFKLQQMNLVELIVIGIPSFFISLQPNTSRVNGKFLKNIIKKSFPGALIMLLSVLAIEIFKSYYGKFPDEYYTTFGVFAFTFAGYINLIEICRPFNKFRVGLVTAIGSFLTFVFLMSCFKGINFLGYAKLLPTEDVALFIFTGGILIFDFILSLILDKIFKIKIIK